MRRLLILLLLLSAGTTLAADRHVLLDIDGDGFADPCPNPAHNDFLTTDGQVACNGTDTFDIDNDGVAEHIYCTPQACVWNMAKSDTCEVHAGTYAKAGTIANEDTAGDGAVDVCDRSDCWQATVTAWGYGPNMGTDGYGTSANPGWLRGAVMNGSTDTWDSDGDKIPDTEAGEPTSYPPIFDGNVDGDGNLKETTSCSGDTCSGDAFYAVFIGCGHSDSFCDPAPDTGQTRPRVDTDGNGVVDSDATTGGEKNVAHFRIRDIEFKNYNGGATTCSSNGVREGLGHIMMGGGQDDVAGSGDGLRLEHSYWHDGAYSNLCATEHYVAVVGDDENHSCTEPEVISDNFIVLDNRFVVNDDCDADNPGASECGCSKDIHGNRIVVQNGSGTLVQGVVRLKSVDSLRGGVAKKVIRMYNNEIIWYTNDSGNSTPIWNECMGTCDPYSPGLGEFWFYGNIMRLKDSGKFKRYAQTFCQEDPTGLRSYIFNNTFDLGRSGDNTNELDDMPCGGTLELMVSKNNAFWKATTVNSDAATTLSQENDICSQTSQTNCPQSPDPTPARTEWWTVGTINVGVHSGLANYIPKGSGPMDEIATNNACDPDDDGVAGVDYDGDGDIDTSWVDIAGNAVSCPTAGTALDLGAIQSSSDDSCGDNVVSGSEACDGTDLAGETCVTLGFFSGTLACSVACTFDTSGCSASACGNIVQEGSEECDGSDLNGETCVTQGLYNGTLGCTASCELDTSGCVPDDAPGNRGPMGTDDNSFIDRGMMDLLYSRQDGTNTSTFTLFGDPNVATTTRGWRLHRTKTAFLEVQANGDEGAAVFDSVGLQFGYVFKTDGTNILAFLPRNVDTVETVIAEVSEAVAAPRVMMPQVVGSDNEQVFSPVDQNRCGGLGVPCTISWVFRSAHNVSNDEGRAVVQLFWNGVSAGDLRGTSNMITAQTDTNSVNVRMKTRAEIAVAGTSPRLFSNVNRAWEINQTKAARGVMQWGLLGVTQWVLNATGDFTDSVGGNLFDTVDVGSHTHVGGGSNGAALGTGSVGATQLVDTTCTGVTVSPATSDSAAATRYFGFDLLGAGPVATEADVQFYKTPTGSVVYHSMRVFTTTAPDNGGGTQSWVITLRDDGADTALSCTISETAQDCTDADSTTPGNGSLMTISVAPSGTPTLSSAMLVMICTGS